LVFLVLRARALAPAIVGSAVLAGAAVALLLGKQQGWIVGAIPWIAAALALILVVGVGRHILIMAYQALRRGILNQHVLLEVGAFAGLVGGAIGLALDRSGYPTAPFFAVSVLIATYHIFSEWLSLIVKTRSSQAVEKLLDLQPETALVLRGQTELELPIEDVRVGDRVRIRPGARVPVDGTVISGRSGVDQAFVTGEPIPLEKAAGDSVSGGSINGTGTLLVKVTAVGEIAGRTSTAPMGKRCGEASFHRPRPPPRLLDRGHREPGRALSRPLPVEPGRQIAGEPASAPGRAQDPRAGDDPKRPCRPDRAA
jgi:Cu+-exporting ATPase